MFDLNFKNEWNFKLACLSGLRFLQWVCGAVFQTEFKPLVDSSCFLWKPAPLISNRKTAEHNKEL